MLVALGAMGRDVHAITPVEDLLAPILHDFGGQGVVGGLYQPVTNGTESRIAVYVMHAESDYLSFSACQELPRRGFTTLCADNAADNTGVMSDIDFESELTQADLGVQYLRNLSGIDSVVLFGHSGGGALMASFQNVAENGVSARRGPEKFYNCTDAVADLHPADDIMRISVLEQCHFSA